MKRSLFLLGVGAISAGCSHHGSSLIPQAPGSGRTFTGDPASAYPARALPASPIVGEVRRFDGAAAPSGWLLCDGSALAIAQYPALYAVLGKSAGGGDALHFDLPKAGTFGMVIAISGDAPHSPKELQAVLSKRPNYKAA